MFSFQFYLISKRLGFDSFDLNLICFQLGDSRVGCWNSIHDQLALVESERRVVGSPNAAWHSVTRARCSMWNTVSNHSLLCAGTRHSTELKVSCYKKKKVLRRQLKTILLFFFIQIFDVANEAKQLSSDSWWQRRTRQSNDESSLSNVTNNIPQITRKRKNNDNDDDVDELENRKLFKLPESRHCVTSINLKSHATCVAVHPNNDLIIVGGTDSSIGIICL